MTSSQPRPAASPSPDADIASALHTFEAQASGIAALASALNAIVE